MDFLHAIIFGAVEGISEFLPISSTGHLMLTARALDLTQTDFLKSFEITIQLGAILSVVVLYWKSLLVNFAIFKRLLVAFLPTAALGLIFYKLVKQYLLASDAVVLWALLIGGIFLIIFELWHRENENATQKLEKISYKNSFIIGLFQSLAIIPGVSRAAATIVGGLILGLKRRAIVEFSFLLAVPTMLAATSLDLLKNASQFSQNQFGFLLIGFIVSFLVAIGSIKFLLRFIETHSFISFGIYRIALALIFWLFIL